MSGAGAPTWARAAREAPAEWHTFAAVAERAQRDGLTHTLVCGMGGSSLTARVLATAFRTPQLQTLDTTAPRTVLSAARRAESTLFVIASKTGTTVETDAMYRFFAGRARPDQFFAITDPGTPLEALARERGFRGVALAPPSVGGRYSALTPFGMVPAALAGLDGAELLRRAAEVDELGARALGARIGDGYRAGRDKLALEPPAPLHALGPWIEQIVAESSGKDGRGIVPLVDDSRALTRPDTQRVSSQEFTRDPLDLGVEFARWAYATDELCRCLEVNAYDQPDVESAKTQTRALLNSDPTQPLHAPSGTLSLKALAADAEAGGYLALLLYVPADAATDARVRELRDAWSRATGLAVTAAYGPAYLHSTGQLHKGGPGTGRYLVVTADDDEDAAIPGLPFTFGRLQRAQALGDVAALQARGRRVAYAHLSRPSELSQLVP